ncbi:hypothetical protein C8J57DRAFT_1308160 [Mycena rebaudengoi]|nr:hypothetical protein C8J57DRAFT_1308160 [Mycena rebaudengoi]
MIYNFKALKTEIRNGWTGANRSLHRTPFEQKDKRLGNESQYNLGTTISHPKPPVPVNTQKKAPRKRTKLKDVYKGIMTPIPEMDEVNEDNREEATTRATFFMEKRPTPLNAQDANDWRVEMNTVLMEWRFMKSQEALVGYCFEDSEPQPEEPQYMEKKNTRYREPKLTRISQ